MKDLKSLIEEAKKKAPPLKFQKNGDQKSVVLIEEELHPMLKKLNKHRSSLNSKMDANSSKCPKDWERLKQNMIIDLETKRKEEYEHQREFSKRNDDEEEDDIEELDDYVMPEDTATSLDDDNNLEDSAIDSAHPSQSPLGESQADNLEDDEALEETENIFGGDDSAGEDDEDEEEAGEELDDDNQESDDDEESQEDRTSNKFSRSILDSDDEENENTLPPTGTKAKKANIIDDDDDNAMDFDTMPFTDMEPVQVLFNAESVQTGDDLASLCSGKFSTQADAISQEDSQSRDSESMNRRDAENSRDSLEDGAGAEKNSDADDSDDEEEEELERPKSKKSKKLRMKDFLEEEAELSGEDGEASSDEEDNEDEYEVDEEAERDNLPDDEELRHQVERIYKKHELDEDKRQLMLLQERFLEDGDLHEGGNRERKFKWNFQNDNEVAGDFTNILSDSEDDDTTQDSDDDGNSGQVIRLKRPDLQVSEGVRKMANKPHIQPTTPATTIIERVEDSVDGIESQPEESQVKVVQQATTSRQVTLSQALESTSMFRQTLIKHKKVTKVSSFFLKDDRLKGILNKRPADATSNVSGPAKKVKRDDDSNSKSIFDLM